MRHSNAVFPPHASTTMTSESVVPTPLPPASHPSPSVLEAASMKAWPAYEESPMGPLMLRYAGGFTKRANSAVLVRQSKVTLTQISAVEAWYGAHGQQPVFRLTEHQNSNLDTTLAKRGYQLADPSLVMANDLSRIPENNHANDVRIIQGEEWLEHERILSNRHHGDQQMMKYILACNAPSNEYVVLEHEGLVVACGLGVRQKDLYAIFCIRTGEAYRRQGFGTGLICAMLQRARQSGASCAWLQVLESNIPAISLYRSLHFTSRYRYWYRMHP
ncbi:GNAT family N-acetyltransferase [Desulfovibrio mangrovi]|uniref:GNAT family N-acetyltransferase n=1 Tax=Desulfovibrio mangrovi TaxID=2976983 RepID=UPI0022453446|nr:GNAT family N-acetyltransferase [Desulfovibrio mangrovi]UZP68996.1 GNAT family N-acetyltransferase [Desulfovibrio mangrovi]